MVLELNLLLFTIFNECKTIASKSLSTAFEKKRSFKTRKNISWCVRLFKINNITKVFGIQTTCMCSVNVFRHVKSRWENCYQSKFKRKMAFLMNTYSGYFINEHIYAYTLYFQMKSSKLYCSCHDKSKVSLTNCFWKKFSFI